jgi:prepilin-type N-terminal cleavage/methylation domain-containing protein
MIRPHPQSGPKPRTRLLGGPPAAVRGLTLVEVLIALTILAVALLPVMLGFAQALITTSQSTVSATATSIAREKVEQLKAQPFSRLYSQPAEARDLNPGDSFFQVEVTVTEIRPDDALLSGIKEAVVTVTRTRSQQPLATLTTYFSPVGI